MFYASRFIYRALDVDTPGRPLTSKVSLLFRLSLPAWAVEVPNSMQLFWDVFYAVWMFITPVDVEFSTFVLVYFRMCFSNHQKLIDLI